MIIGWETALQLPRKFAIDKLQHDLQAVEHFNREVHPGPYHDGSWSGISLISRGGKSDSILEPRPGTIEAELPYQKTEALDFCPYFNEIIDSFECRKKRVRLLALPPGGTILEHIDEGTSIDGNLIRLHIPIVTDPQVIFILGGKYCRWKPGELWYGDFSFPHKLKNCSQITRVHLVIDLPVTPESLQLFPREYIQRKLLRKINLKLQLKMKSIQDRLIKK